MLYITATIEWELINPEFRYEYKDVSINSLFSLLCLTVNIYKSMFC